jgi:lysophospholipase L1-like esterase
MVYRQSSYQAQGSSAAAQSSGHLFLSGNGSQWSGNNPMTMYRVVAYPTQLSSADILLTSNNIRNEVASRGVPVLPLNIPTPTPILHAIGDSITQGANVSNPWPSLLALAATTPSFTVHNWGLSGLKTIEIVGSEKNRVALQCKTESGVPSVATLLLGTNDFGYGVTTTAASVMAELGAEISVLHNAGCLVLVGTILSRPGTDPNGIGGDANKDAYDQLILQTSRNAGANGIIDFAANPFLGADGANANLTYFQADHLHPTQVGVNLMATIASNSINYYFGYSLSNPHSVTANTYTLTSADGAVIAAPTGTAAYTMPDCVGPSGEKYTIINSQSAFALTVIGGTSQPINGLATAITIPSNTSASFLDVPNPKTISGCSWSMIT